MMIHPLLVVVMLIAMMAAFGLLTLSMAETLRYEPPRRIRRIMHIIGGGQLVIALMMCILVVVFDYAKIWAM